MSKIQPSNEQKDVLYDCLRSLKGYFIYAALFSAAVNILMLTPIIYMLQVYDRVVSSGSMTTLSMLTLLMLLLLVSAGGFEWVRSKLLIAANVRLERSLRQPLAHAAFTQTILSGGQGKAERAMGDLTGLRQFATGQGVFALMDLPWVPIYIGVMFLFHPLFGVAAILTMMVLITLAVITQRFTTKKLETANALSRNAYSSFESNIKNAEVIFGMGMEDNIRQKDGKLFDEATDRQAVASSVAGRLAAISKSFRQISQSILLGLGAYLALTGEISPGMMIAGSLLLGRALAPIDMMVGTWKGFVDAAAAFGRLRQILNSFRDDGEKMRLPSPTGEVSVENIIVAPPLSQIAVLKGLSFEIAAGEALGVIGPSAAGKTTLARSILGIWRTNSGTVRLDGADIKSWNRHQLGPFLGYLPQDIELFDGTIAQNICRFSTPEPDAIIEAAKTAGIHDMVLRLPEGYETHIGATSGILSAGQRQRLGLARAIFGKPRLIVLDEPNSNLDDEGERELLTALRKLRESGSTIIVITHRTSILAIVDKLLFLTDGTVRAFGKRDQVLKAIEEAKSKVTPLQSQAAPRT